MPTPRLQSALDRAAIAERLPHTGDMVLLDAVEGWDAHSIHCRTWSHLRNDNPLRRGPELGTATAIEYGAQAMALHGGLLTGTSAPAGMVAAARHVRMRMHRLDGVFSALSVAAHLLAQDRSGARYAFELSSAGGVIAAGQITVVFTRTR